MKTRPWFSIRHCLTRFLLLLTKSHGITSTTVRSNSRLSPQSRFLKSSLLTVFVSALVATAVCQDLVSVDQHDRNPFRTLVPLSGKFDFLEAIIVATGAMHMASLHGSRQTYQPSRTELIDALVAKDKAIRLLRTTISDLMSRPENQAMVLAATVFLINVDLIDSGKGGWQAHIEAATALMSSVHQLAQMMDPSLVTLVDAIAADCLTYRVLSAAISGVALPPRAEKELVDLFSILKRAEPYSYHCCPPDILRIILSASCLGDEGRIEAALMLFQQARTFDVVNWVYSIRGLSPNDDLPVRVSIALAHRATACLYVLLAVPEAATGSLSPDMLVEEVLNHLAGVPIDHVLLKGTVWPTFMAGAQTDNPKQRQWCIERLEAVWARNPWICPWGYIRTAIEMLNRLWQARDSNPAGPEKTNWLQEVRSMRDKCLIV